VKKLNKEGGSSFTIRTPVGVAGIRGTAFRLAFLEEGGRLASFDLVMLEGEIEVGLSGQGRSVVVTQGKQLKLDHIRTDSATGRATLPASAGIVVSDASASTRTAVAQAVQTMISVADTVPVSLSGAGSADNTGGAAGKKMEADGAEQSAPRAGVPPLSLPPPARFPGWAGNAIRPRM
jgi:hypothetical protein